MPERDDNPYIGPRPYERADRPLFFGRDREVRELLSLVIAHRVVLLYATSGAGKTSLLNAGLLPVLEEEEGFEVFPPARFAGGDLPPGFANPFVHNIVENWRRGIGGATSVQDASLAQFLAGHAHAVDADGFAAPRLVVFDQFEELFTLYQQHWRLREPFFVQLAELLDNDPLLRVMIAIREDYLAQLDRYGRHLPGAIRTRLRLERLSAEAALTAVTQPVERTERRYAPGVAEQLVGDLLQMRVDTGGGLVEIEGEYVEPVQLQVTCRSLWDALPQDVVEITSAHLETFGDVDEVLSSFYADAIVAAANAGGIRESDLRAKLERTFITQGGTRGTVYAAAGGTDGIPNGAIDELERRHLVRAEFRAGARWLELTHDRLIEPIRASNRDRLAEFQRRRRRRAAAAFVVLVALAGGALAAVAWLWDSGSPKVVALRPRATQASLAKVLLRQRVANCSPTLAVRTHSGPMLAAAFSSGGGLIETASEDGTARLWQCTDARELPSLRIRLGSISAAAFARDGATLFTASTTRRPRIWSVADGRSHAVGNKVADSGSFAADGRIVVTIADGHARLIDVKTGKTLARVNGTARSAAVSPDGQVVTVSGGRGAWSTITRLWDVRRKEMFASFETGTYPNAAKTYAFSHDGQLLAIAGKGYVEVEDVIGGLSISHARLPTKGGAIANLAFSPDDAFLATATGDGVLRLFRVPLLLDWLPNNTPVGSFRGSGAALRSVAFSPDGDGVVTADDDGVARVWPTTRARVVACARAALDKQVRYVHVGDPNSVRKRREGLDKHVRLPRVPQRAGPESLVSWCYQQAGGPDPEGRGFRGNGYAPFFERQGRRVAKPKPGDVAIFDWDRNGLADMTAIYVGKGRVVRFHVGSGSSSRLVLSRAEIPGVATRYRSYLP